MLFLKKQKFANIKTADYEKTKVIFGLSTPKNIKKHQKSRLKKQNKKFVAQCYSPCLSVVVE